MSSNNKLVSMIIGIFGAVWCVAMIGLANMSNYHFSISGAMLFGIVAIVISIIYMMVLRGNTNREAVEVSAISIYYTFIYSALSIIVNSVFTLVGYGYFNMALAVVNLLMIAVYIVLIINAKNYNKRVTDQLEIVNQKTYNTAIISEKLGLMLNLVDDPQIKKQLLSLKESVDYSSNISNNKTYESEKIMESCLDEIKDMIINHDDISKIKSKVTEAEFTWKSRTNRSSSKV